MCAEGYRKVVKAGTHHRARLPVTWRMLLDGESSIPAWGIGGESHVVVLEPQLSFYDRSIRRDLASSSGVAHPAHCLMRKDVAFISGNSPLEYVHGRQADKVEVNVRGQKGDQDQIGEMNARAWDETSGPQSGYRADGGAVALMVELMSCHATWPDDAPLSSYRILGSYIWRIRDGCLV